MPISTTMEYVLNSLVIMLCSVYRSIIYKKRRVRTVHLFIEQPLYISLFCVVTAYSSQFLYVHGADIMTSLLCLYKHIVV